MEKSIDIKLEKWKNRLLDLGKRNRLLNFKETKRSTLQIKEPGIFELWHILVDEEKEIEFPYYDEYENNSNKKKDRFVVTNQSISEMHKSLRNLRDKAKSFNEEQGINVLYLSFGLIEWKENIDKGQILKSPLLLVPVTLSVESISDPYILSLHEDEIIVNPTLKYKFENDFGIILPDYENDYGLDDYLRKIEKNIVHNNWKIEREVYLSLFSFLKINMYKDLIRYKDRIKMHSVVRTICGDTSRTDKIPDDILDFDFDSKTKPIDIFQVVDADASQQDAILFAKKGISFVLQGPPGTGKSQTITNVIAECLADGKKVLFVSEKMAALDVVYRRLTTIGLNNFCLVMHSYKANKKEVLEQFEAVLRQTKNKISLTDEAFFKLKSLEEKRDQLNDYATQISEKVKPLGKSIFEINGLLSNLLDYPDVIFPIPNIEKVDLMKFSEYIKLLSDYKKSMNKMSEDFDENPWNGSSVEFLTNELRHDIGAKLLRIIDKVSNYEQSIENIQLKMVINKPKSYNLLLEIIDILKISKESPNEVPEHWITSEQDSNLIEEVTECNKIKTEYLDTRNELIELYNKLEKINDNIKSEKVVEILNIQDIKVELNKLKSIVTSDETIELIYNCPNIEQLLKEKEVVIEKGNNIQAKIDEILVDFEPNILNIEHENILRRFRTEYNSIFKMFKSTYREDKKLFKSLYKNYSVKLTDEKIIQILTKLKEISELRSWLSSNVQLFREIFFHYYDEEKTDFSKIDEKIELHKIIKGTRLIFDKLQKIANDAEEIESTLLSHYSFLYNGFKTSWEEIREKLVWASSFREVVLKYKVDSSFVNKVCIEKEFVNALHSDYENIVKIKQDIDEEFVWYCKLFYYSNDLKNMNFSDLKNRVKKSSESLFLLEEWIDFRNARTRCEDEGLSEYTKEIEKEKIKPDSIIPIFQKRFYRLWLDAFHPKFPAVQNFRRVNQESTIKEFAELDKLQMDIAKARIQSKLINNLPNYEHFTSGLDEISILKRELGKKRKIMPLRKLFKLIPNLLLAIKPCLMMSPLSVSLFLEAESYEFDTVIFDEASQVSTENAIGAISRGKQVIIAGDSKQLPPTNFFGTTLSDTDFDTDDEIDDDSNSFESIIDEANLLPERTLLWHYRSRHEHLITFSNAKIYKNNLITFPSTVDKIDDNGVEYFYVKDGFYDRGGRKGNVIEAEKVAELVFDHFRKFPNRSLGVIAFGEVQQQAIDTIIRKKRMENQNFEMFFKEDLQEPFFVKNLENVQGDERDTIIFSVGYAKDANGVFRMNFGPLSRNGGERRLNVAITRAKYNVKLVGSILPTDIKIDSISTEGPKLLRGYIDFAMNGIKSLQNDITESDIVEHDSPFEESVYNFLSRKGYSLATQVGCSGYRIDMAVKHPTLNGVYVLGIECDGATYHSARTARERDRLRQDVLEQMGWKIYRIWSTDWIKDQNTEGKKLIDAIESALSYFNNPFELDDIEQNEESDLDEDQSGENNSDAYLVIEEKAYNNNPYAFPIEKEVSYDHLLIKFGYISIENYINEVVKTLFPIHYDLLCRKLASLYGNEKVTAKIRLEVDRGLNLLKDKVIRKGEFFYPLSYKKVEPRQNNNRKIEHVSEEELSAAMLYVLDKCVGITRDGLCTETARSYNYNRISKNISLKLDNSFNLLLERNKINIQEDKIFIND